MALRLMLVAIAAAAVGIGFLLPAPHGARAAHRSQLEQLEIGRR